MEKTTLRRRVCVVCATVLIAMASGALLAQEEPAPSPTPPAEQPEAATPGVRPVVIKEIIVTAQKRTENVQEVPLAVSTLGGEDFEAITAGAPDVRILSARVPSLILESSFGRAFPRFYIRGLGNTDFDLNASQPVSMLVDEVVLENPIVKGMPLFDIDRVEVLRGPQGIAVRAQHARRRGQVRDQAADPGFRGRPAHLLRQLRHLRRLSGGGRRGAHRHRLGPLLGSVPVAQSDWVDNKHTGREGRARRLRDHRLPPAAAVGAERHLQRPVQPPRLGDQRRHRADLPRQRHPVRRQHAGRRTSTRHRLPGRSQLAGHRARWVA